MLRFFVVRCLALELDPLFSRQILLGFRVRSTCKRASYWLFSILKHLRCQENLPNKAASSIQKGFAAICITRPLSCPACRAVAWQSEGGSFFAMSFLSSPASWLSSLFYNIWHYLTVLDTFLHFYRPAGLSSLPTLKLNFCTRATQATWLCVWDFS